MSLALNLSRLSALSACAALALTAGLAHAASPAGKSAIVGVWKSKVEITNCAGVVLRTFDGMQVFHAHGTLTDTNSADLTTRGPGMGVWHKVAPNQYSARFTIMNYVAGVHTTWAVVTRQITLAPDGNSATGTTQGELYDLNGNLLATNCGSDTAQRFQ